MRSGTPWAAAPEPGPWLRARVLPALGYGLLAVLLLLIRGSVVQWAIAAAGAFRLVGTAWSIATTPAYTHEDTGDTVAQDLDLADNPALADLARRMATEEQGRAGIDRGWIAAFIVTLFGIHLGRMGLDRSTLGILSPIVAVLGDLALALIIAFGVVIPARLFTRRVSRGLERRAWAWCLDAERPAVDCARWSAAGSTTGSGSPCASARRGTRCRAALSRGLQIGLPAAAFVAATSPVFGMSWFFDTENWAAGMWNSLGRGAHRHLAGGDGRDACFEHEPRVGAEAFAVSPPGVVERRGLLVPRHRRSRRGRRVAADPAGPAARGGPRARTCASS